MLVERLGRTNSSYGIATRLSVLEWEAEELGSLVIETLR